MRAAPTAVSLMRSRYSAFVVQNGPYLLRTWHPDTRPAQVSFDDDHHWLGLTIHRVAAGGLLDAHGHVEFTARFHHRGRPGELHEHSAFERVQHRWVYSGAVPSITG